MLAHGTCMGLNRVPCLQGVVPVTGAAHFMGKPDTYAMIGISKTLQYCYQVIAV